MKKSVKKILASLLALLVLFGTLNLDFVKAHAADDFTAFLMFSDRNWAYGNWDSALESATTKVSGEGTYTVKLNAADVKGEATADVNGAMVFCVDIEGAQAALDADNMTFKVSDVTVECDGTAIEFASSKVVAGDIEGNGNFRIELYNEYGKTAEDAPFDKEAFTFKDTLSVTFTLKKVQKGTETAFLMFSDRNWAYGNWDAGLAAATTDVCGAGDYSVTLKAADVKGDTEAAVNGAMVFCVDILKATADMAAEGKTFNVTALEVLCDGKAVDTDVTKAVWGDIEENGNFRIEIYNEYGATSNAGAIDFNALTFNDSLTVNFSLEVVDAAAPMEHTAFLMFSDRNWAYGNWDANLEAATTTIAGNGSYSVTLNAADVKGDATAPVAGAMVFGVDVVGLANSVKDVAAITVSDVSILADGQEVTFDPAKMVFGDLENNGNFRIELYNEYGATAADPGLDKEAFTFNDTLTVNFTLDGIVYSASTTEKTREVIPVDLNGEYNAYLGFQTPVYSFRNTWFSTSYGLGYDDGSGIDYFHQVTGWDSDNNAVTKAGTFEDVVIKGNGTYTVKATGLDLTGEFDSQSYFNIISVSTDIPDSGEITVSDIVLKIDGKTVSITPLINSEETDYITIDIQNIWNDSIKEIGAYTVPCTEMEVTFTLSGFAYDKTEDAAPAETTSTETSTATQSVDTAETAPATQTVEKAGVPVWVWIVIAVVVVVAAVAVVLVSKKKKASK